MCVAIHIVCTYMKGVVLTHRPLLPPLLSWKPSYFVFQNNGNFQEMFLNMVYLALCDI